MLNKNQIKQEIIALLMSDEDYEVYCRYGTKNIYYTVRTPKEKHKINIMNELKKGATINEIINQLIVERKEQAISVEGARLENVKKIKPFYYVFDIDERKVTICVAVDEDDAGKTNVGYSVKSPTDKFDKELGKKIAYGRSQSKSKLSSDKIGENYKSKAVFEGIAKLWENRIKNNHSRFIKSIK